MEVIRSRQNPFYKSLLPLAQRPGAVRRQGKVWIEGEHLCQACIAQGQQPEAIVLAESLATQGEPPWMRAATQARWVVLSDALMQSLSGLESPSAMGLLLPSPPDATPEPGLAGVLLDRLQDPGNVGSILRSAAAMGFGQVLTTPGTVALWSPKVLRAGMGAHFGLRLVEGLDASQLEALAVPILATVPQAGQALHEQALPWPCLWCFGHEGQGLSEAVLRQATHRVRINQPGGQESLNVAAAAAICLHASAAGAGVPKRR